MRKYELLKSSDTILRVLEVEQDRVLVIDCIKQTMPVWLDRATADYYCGCSEEILQEVTGIKLVEQDLLDAEQKKIMHQRYTMIAPVLTFIGDGKMRSQIIQFVAEKYGVTKQTIRNYLCQYLAYMDTTALAPKCKSVEPNWQYSNEMRTAKPYGSSPTAVSWVVRIPTRFSECPASGKVVPSAEQFP